MSQQVCQTRGQTADAHGLSSRDLDLNRIVWRFEATLRNLLARNVELLVHCGLPLEHVHADEIDLETVLIHLVVNAGDAMPQGGQVTLETSRAVADVFDPSTGPGSRYVLLCVRAVPGEAEPVSSLTESTTREGAAKSVRMLDTVRRTIAGFGGRVFVSAIDGGGWTFRVYLPAVT